METEGGRDKNFLEYPWLTLPLEGLLYTSDRLVLRTLTYVKHSH